MKIGLHFTLIATIFLFINIDLVSGQTDNKGVIEGRIYNETSNEPVPFANIVVFGTTIGTASNFDGEFLFTGIQPGFVKLQVSAVGFEDYISPEIMVTNAKKVYIDIPLKETSVALDEVVVKANVFRKTEESPVSLRRIGIREIEKSPGANRDISKVIQSFPGVASTPAQRNDVIVRGGGPSENSFFLDGVEIPNLNHFATQGASGGPVGIINVDFIREVKFYSGAFPANRGNALSSVIEFQQKDGNPEKLEVQGTLGASEVALTLDGPIGDKTTYIFSARRSYLQFLFKVLGLPFLPTYNDAQFKVKTKLDEKNELTFIGLGAIDDFKLNLEANDTEDQRYILNYVPVNEQYSYTVGAVYKHFREKSYDTWVLSHNYLNNSSYKYQDNIEVDSLKILDYLSTEAETKFRYENTTRTDNGYKVNYGVGSEYAIYTNDTYQQIFLGGTPTTVDYDSRLDFFKWNVFGQVSRDFFDRRLGLSLGVRADANSYSAEMSNLFDQISPRFSASYRLTPEFSLNMNTGRYYQEPAYTTLGFRDNSGTLVNKQNGISYISVDHVVAGVEYQPSDQSTLSVEGFYKYYRDYPFSVRDSINIASKGGDFGTFGDEEVLSIAEGHAYGMEVLGRHRDLLGFNVVLSYTLVRSEFKDFNDDLELQDSYTSTAWDNIHLLNITATRSFKRNWDFGFKWRFVGGSPYTPFDYDKSSYIAAWNARGRGYPDFSMFNEKRLDSFHQLDVRVDKQYFFDKWSLMIYVDVQNLYNYKSDEPDRLIRATDEEGNPLIDPENPDKYVLRTIESDGSGTVLPSLGIIVQF